MGTDAKRCFPRKPLLCREKLRAAGEAQYRSEGRVTFAHLVAATGGDYDQVRHGVSDLRLAGRWPWPIAKSQGGGSRVAGNADTAASVPAWRLATAQVLAEAVKGMGDGHGQTIDEVYLCQDCGRDAEKAELAAERDAIY